MYICMAPWSVYVTFWSYIHGRTVSSYPAIIRYEKCHRDSGLDRFPIQSLETETKQTLV